MGAQSTRCERRVLYRDALIQAHTPLSRLASGAMLSKNNHSGISGLTRVDRVELSGRPQRRLCWEAHCPMGQGRAKRKRFSIRKYGEEGAFQRALAAREAALHALAEQTVSPVHAHLQRTRLLAMPPRLRHAMNEVMSRVPNERWVPLA